MTDSKTQSGNLAELKVAFELTHLGHEIYFGFGGKTTCDLIALKDKQILKVQIKSTSYQTKSGWYVMIQSVRPNKTANIIKHYNAEEFDILAVYIAPEDRVILYESKDITAKCGFHIKPLESTANWMATGFERQGG